MTTFSRGDAMSAARTMGIDWEDELFELEDLLVGMNAETATDLAPEAEKTGGDPVLTARVAIARLRESPDYYAPLREMEQEARVAEAEL